MFFLLISGILGMFVNTLIDHEMYSLRNRKNLLEPIQMQLYKERKILNIFEKKDGPHRLCISEISLRKMWLLKCLKSPLSGHPLRVNMLKSRKHC